MRALPREARQALRMQLREERAQSIDPAKLLGVLRADPFDPEAAARVVATQLEGSRISRESVQDAWLAQVTAMTGQERISYAGRIEELSRQRKERREAK